MVNLVYDKEYKGYVADVPELPGCMSQGRTIEKALENVREAVVAYRKALRPKGAMRPGSIFTTQIEV
jgi:predicted RNase H-like HicB family nuclease